MPLQGGEEHKVLESVYLVNYAIGRRGIFFEAMPDTSHNTGFIEFFSFETGKITSMATIHGIPEWGLSVSPDEEYLLYSRIDLSGGDLMLVENFR